MCKWHLFGATLGILFTMTTSCATILGIDQDYFKADGGDDGGLGGERGDGGDSGGDAGSCETPKILCDGQCVDTRTDPAYCGGCDGACPMAGTECQMRTCTNEVCGSSFAMAGMPTLLQTAGDCRERQCDGTGKIADAVKNADLPVDGNPCTDDLCTNGVPSNPPTVAGASCDPGGHAVCNGSGACLPSDGQMCAQNTACASDNCVDGVCCGSSACGTCQACDLTGNGTCGNIPLGQPDPNSSPACNGASLCDGSGACKKILGQSCTAGVQCLTGNCIDGVCCNSACGAICQACNLVSNGGTCVNIPLGGIDSNPGCNSGGILVCNGSGQCLRANGQSCTLNSECASNKCQGSPKACIP
jgi:hypothetical protein